MIDIDAAFSQEFFNVTVGQPVAQIPAHRHCDHFWWEPETRRRRTSVPVCDRTTAHQITLPDLRSVKATVPVGPLQKIRGTSTRGVGRRVHRGVTGRAFP
jgi:hypothetical protein